MHLLVELYARSLEEATEVLEEAARGRLTITSLAEESRPPAATAATTRTERRSSLTRVILEDDDRPRPRQ